MSPVLIDGVLLLILLLCLIAGARRGLVLSIAGLLTMAIAVSGAYYCAKSFSPAVGEWMQPKIQTFLEEQYRNAAPDKSGGGSQETSGPESGSESGQVVSTLKKLGIYDRAASYLSDVVTQKVNAAGTAASAALSETFSHAIAFWAVFAIGFFLLLILLSIIGRALNLIARLPGLHLINRLGGALFGLAKGLLILFLLAWAAQFLGSVLPEETVSKTYLLRALMEGNPIPFLPTL